MRKTVKATAQAREALGEKILERFIRYARVDTQSRSDAKTIPTTAGQWTLLRLLQAELKKLGAQAVSLSSQGHLMATIPASVRGSKSPTIAFLSHVDTSGDFSGTGVKPIVHRRWNGRPIRLPDDPSRILDPKHDPDLASMVGKDIVTASGRTLLGGDDKAGVAIIMTLVEHLLTHAELPHGPLRVCFLPDEEVGLRGAAQLDLDRLGANAGYTLDGKGSGEVVGESFSGDSATVTIQGVSTHPGEAKKHRMVNAVHLAGKLLAALPREFISPETTEDHQGYIHPNGIEGNPACAKIRFILRDFDDAGLADKRRRLTGLCQGFQAAEPRARVTCEFSRGYRNMAEGLRQDPRPLELAREAVRSVGLEPTSPPIRGGTDGSLLSERGLPTPNLSCGEHNFHGPLEWVCVQEMEQCLGVCLKLVELWHHKGTGFRGYRSKKR
jgi:tripeptide aminopeptidase